MDEEQTRMWSVLCLCAVTLGALGFLAWTAYKLGKGAEHMAVVAGEEMAKVGQDLRDKATVQRMEQDFD
jgi:hypothetical protein